MLSIPVTPTRLAEIIIIVAIILLVLYIFYQLNLFKRE